MTRLRHKSIALPLARPLPWPFSMRQKWSRLLFMHTPVSPDYLQGLLPDCLVPDCMDGLAWLSVVPFQLTYWLPGLAFPLKFNELNLRTYVKPAKGYTREDPGVYFFCLDASDWLSVEAARTFFSLNYFHATSDMAINAQKGIHFRSVRNDPRAESAAFEATYQPLSTKADNIVRIQTREHTWLTERYRLYSVSPSGALYTATLSHPPWQLQPVACTIQTNTLWQAHGFLPPAANAPLLMAYAEEVSVLANPATKVT